MKIPCAYKNEALTVKAVANSFFVFTVALWQTFENLDKARSKHFISYGINLVFLLISVYLYMKTELRTLLR